MNELETKINLIIVSSSLSYCPAGGLLQLNHSNLKSISLNSDNLRFIRLRYEYVQTPSVDVCNKSPTSLIPTIVYTLCAAPLFPFPYFTIQI